MLSRRSRSRIILQIGRPVAKQKGFVVVNATKPFTDGNVAGNIMPTELMAAWFNTVQRELIAVLSAAGIKPDKTDDAQVIKAINEIPGDGIGKALVSASTSVAVPDSTALPTVLMKQWPQRRKR